MDMALIKPNNMEISKYLYSMLRYSRFPDIIKEFANGVNVLHLNQSSVENYEFVHPDIKIIRMFAELISPIYKLVDILQLKNDCLSKTRDILLPKLISGELDIENLEIKV
jgi:type I restriction enzyme S subunit